MAYRKLPAPNANELDYAQIEELYALFASDWEVANVVGLHNKTLWRRAQSDEKFAEAKSRGRARAYIELRRAQWKRAVNGNPALLIFLGKNYLGQKNENTLSVENHKTLDVSKLSNAELEIITQALKLIEGELSDDTSGEAKEEFPLIPGASLESS